MTLETFLPKPEDGDFDCLRRAEDSIRARGFSLGPLQRSDPRGIMPAEWDVQKWRNLSRKDRAELVAVMTFVGDPRRPAAIHVERKGGSK
jgi:hypothetical protein